MRKLLTITAALVALAPALTLAPAPAAACPPGLAKKHNGCMPPGLAKKRYGGHRHYLDHRYVVIEEPWRYGLDPRYDYYRRNARVYRVDRETREVLDLIGAVSAILN